MRNSRIVVSAAAAAVLSARAGFAQHLSVAAVGAQTTHKLLPRSTGVGGTLTVPLWRRAGLSVLVERTSGGATGMGVVCAGLVNPDRCPVEPFEQSGTLFSFGVGADLSLWRSEHVDLAALPHVLFAHARSSLQGSLTRNELDAEKSQLGFSGALEARVTPAPSVPLAFVLGAATRRVGPVSREQVVDGYTPFEGWYTVRTVYAGASLSWHLPPRDGSR